MEPQQLDFFTNLTHDINVYLSAYARVEGRFQEAFDRELDSEILGLDFVETGELDHLTPQALLDAFAAFTAIQVTMNDNGRARWTALLGVLRSWNR